MSLQITIWKTEKEKIHHITVYVAHPDHVKEYNFAVLKTAWEFVADTVESWGTEIGHVTIRVREWGKK